jgi:hypothetical protein
VVAAAKRTPVLVLGFGAVWPAVVVILAWRLRPTTTTKPGVHATRHLCPLRPATIRPWTVPAVDRTGLRAWIERYERAWRTAGTDLLATLFALEATYRTAPFEEPFRGLPAIAAMWEADRDGPDEVFHHAQRGRRR